MTTAIGWSAESVTQFATRPSIFTKKSRMRSFSSLSSRFAKFRSKRQSRLIARALRCVIRRKPKARITTRQHSRANAATAATEAADEVFAASELPFIAVLAAPQNIIAIVYDYDQTLSPT